MTNDRFLCSCGHELVFFFWTIAEKSRADVIMNDGEESGSGGGWSGVSDNSSTDSQSTILEASSVASDQDGLTLHMRHFGIFPRAFMTSTPGSMPGGSLVTTHLALLSDGQAKLRELVHLPRNWSLLSDPGYQQCPGCTSWEGNPDSHALDIDPG